MSIPTLQQGIQSIQQGKHSEGARLLKIALRDDTLAPNMQAVGWMWLAETSSDNSFKVQCYQRAAAIDPSNQIVNERLSQLLTQQLPPRAPTSPAPNDPYAQPPANPIQQPGYQQPVSGDTGQYRVQNPQPRQLPDYPAMDETGQFIPRNPQPRQTNSYPAADNRDPYGMNRAQQQPYPAKPQPDPYSRADTQSVFPVQPAQRIDRFPAVNPNIYPEPQPRAGDTSPFMPQQDIFNLAKTRSSMPTQFQRSATRHIQGAQRSVGIMDGANGRATGFFLTRNGLLATSRYAIGGIEEVVIELANRETLSGFVVRSFPEFDLALIQVNATVSQLMPVTPTPMLPENTELIAVVHPGQGIRSSRRITRHQLPPFWFPTTTNRLLDAGGNPVYAGNTLVGMLTHNASRANGYFYGLHIAKIYECVEQYTQEATQLAGMQTTYCRHCGIISRAKNFAGYYCEHCGSTQEYSLELTRMPQTQLAQLYGENMTAPCPNCAATAGFYNNKCLRCAYDIARHKQ